MIEFLADLLASLGLPVIAPAALGGLAGGMIVGWWGAIPGVAVGLLIGLWLEDRRS